MTGMPHVRDDPPRPIRRVQPPRLHDVAVREGAHRACVQAARAGACATCIAIVDAIIERGRVAAKQRRLLAS
jgi:hypothetical protein